MVTTPEAKNTTLEFSVPGTVTASCNSIVYLSGQNVPLTVPISVISNSAGDNSTHFTASFPFASGLFANGLTIAALVNSAGQTFASNDDVAAATIFGPGLIEVN